MANQQFNDKFRECLWKVHGQRCFYCENPITFVELEIDHVVPEYLLNNPSEFEKVKKGYALEENFKIAGIENLVPACSKCNGKKSNLTFTIGQIAIFLAKIKTSKI